MKEGPTTVHEHDTVSEAVDSAGFFGASVLDLPDWFVQEARTKLASLPGGVHLAVDPQDVPFLLVLEGGAVLAFLGNSEALAGTAAERGGTEGGADGEEDEEKGPDKVFQLHLIGR